MYKIDTIFYFCNTAAEYDMENVPEGTDLEPAGIDPRTIVFIADTGEIRKAGILYGGIEDETLINKIKTVISNHPDSLPVATSDSLGAIKVGDSFTMTDSDVIGSNDKLEIKWDYLLSKLKNYTSGTGEDGVNLQTINSRLSEVERINSAQATSITTNRSDIDFLVSRLNADIANLAALATRVGANETDIASLRTLYNNLDSWLASDSELQLKLDALKTMLQNVDTGMLTRLTDLETAWAALDAAVQARLKSSDYETEMAAIRSALDRMIDAGELASLEATLRELINNNKLDADTKMSTINSTLSQITEAWVVRTISNLFTDWEFVKSLNTDHVPMTWEPRLKEFIQIVVGNMADDDNNLIWSMFEQKYNELLTKIEGIQVLTDGEGAVSIDQLVAIIKSYINVENFEAVNEMKTFWAKIKSAYEDKEINTNDPEWLQKLEEILKNYETYEWVVAGFESRSSEEMNLAQQFAQAQAKNTEHDTAIYQHGQRLTDDEARLAQAEGDIDALELRASTIETNLNAEASARTSAITDLQNKISSAESSIGSHTSAIETINTTISTLDGKVTANETNIATLTSDAGLTSNAVSDLKSRMQTAENNLSAKANASDVYTITEIDGKVTTINNSISGEAELRQAVENDLASYKTTVTNDLGAKANINDVYSKTDIDGKVSTINTNVTAASNLAQEAKNDFSNWKNDETDGYKAFTTSTSNALTSKASVSYVDGIKDDLLGQINNLESGVTTSSDIQGWLDNGTLKLQGNTVAQMYSQIGNDISSAVSTKADSSTVTTLDGKVTNILSAQSSMSSRIDGVESQISTTVKKDSNGKITSDIILDSDHVTITAAVIEASGASFTAKELHTINDEGIVDIAGKRLSVSDSNSNSCYITPTESKWTRTVSGSTTEVRITLNGISSKYETTGGIINYTSIHGSSIDMYSSPDNAYSLTHGTIYVNDSGINISISDNTDQSKWVYIYDPVYIFGSKAYFGCDDIRIKTSGLYNSDTTAMLGGYTGVVQVGPDDSPKYLAICKGFCIGLYNDSNLALSKL